MRAARFAAYPSPPEPLRRAKAAADRPSAIPPPTAPSDEADEEGRIDPRRPHFKHLAGANVPRRLGRWRGERRAAHDSVADPDRFTPFLFVAIAVGKPHCADVNCTLFCVSRAKFSELRVGSILNVNWAASAEVARKGRLSCIHYRLRGDLMADLWFDGQRRLVRQQMVEHGYATELRLVRLTTHSAPVAIVPKQP
jgi:hypothetical protein